jgi:ketosteroid isomerase-like protein
MMKLLAGLALLLMISPTIFAQQSNASALKEMVETEQAFSKTAEAKNTRDAFMEFIADDGLLFRPGAVNGKKWMTEHPVPPSDKRPLLAWQPAFAQMAAAGDLGFTTGPWEFKADIKDPKPAGYGHFVTLWKKQPDGSWKFVVDLGISHAQSGGPLNIWQVENTPQKNSFKSVDVAKTKEILLQRDRSYSSETLKVGWATAFETFAAVDARLYLPEHLPYLGRTLAVEIIGSTKSTPTYQLISGDVSKSGDLGYTHGTYERTASNDPKKVAERGNYVRIWKKQDSVWQIVLDVTNPVP